MYGGSVKELYTFYSSRLKQRQTYCCDGAEAPCLLLQRLKIPIDNNALCQEEKEIRELHLDFCRLEPGPRPARLMQPQQGSFFMFPCPCSSSSFLNGHCHWHTLSERGIFSVCFFSAFIFAGASSPHCVLLILLKGKHFLEALIWVARVRSQQESLTTWWD